MKREKKQRMGEGGGLRKLHQQQKRKKEKKKVIDNFEREKISSFACKVWLIRSILSYKRKNRKVSGKKTLSTFLEKRNKSK